MIYRIVRVWHIFTVQNHNGGMYHSVSIVLNKGEKQKNMDINLKNIRCGKWLQILLSVCCLSFPASASSLKETYVPQSGISVFDMTARNTGESENQGDYSRQLYSAQYICDIAGNPYSEI